MVEHAVDRSLDEREVVAVRIVRVYVTRTICVSQICVWWGDHISMRPQLVR